MRPVRLRDGAAGVQTGIGDLVENAENEDLWMPALARFRFGETCRVDVVFVMKCWFRSRARLVSSISCHRPYGSLPRTMSATEAKDFHPPRPTGSKGTLGSGENVGEHRVRGEARRGVEAWQGPGKPLANGGQADKQRWRVVSRTKRPEILPKQSGIVYVHGLNVEC